MNILLELNLIKKFRKEEMEKLKVFITFSQLKVKPSSFDLTKFK